jgi:IS5 family transposase
MSLREGTIVDATILAAPSSTKNRERQRDPEMHQTRKGQQWYFGMKAHVGVDAQSGLVHRVIGTAAHVSDVSQTRALLHGQEKTVHADAGYQGADKRPEMADVPGLDWQIAAKRGRIKALPEGEEKERLQRWERAKAQVRALVEHPFASALRRCPSGCLRQAISLRSVHIIKNLFRHRKVRYRGLAKNTAQLHTLFALANLLLASRRLSATPAR